MKRIVFGITSLGLGGAERVLVDLANRLCNEYDITIFTIYANGELEKELSPKIKIQHICNCAYEELTKEEKQFIVFKILIFKQRLYKEYIHRKYDVEIAFLEGPITRIFASYGNRRRKIAWIHNDITKIFGTGWKAFIKKRLDKQNYRRFGKLIFVSKDNKEKFESIYKIKVEKQVIYNYIDISKVKEKANEIADVPFKDEDFNIVTVSRIVEQKALLRYLDVHKKLIENGYNNKMYIIGDGPQKELLQEKIKEYKLEKSFILLGKKENPYPYIKNATVFCLPSYFEGYPMTIIEAKILNKFVVITDTAARETLNNYDNCLIVDNTEEKIYEGLVEIINKKNIKLEAEQNYDNEDIIEQIKGLLDTKK